MLVLPQPVGPTSSTGSLNCRHRFNKIAIRRAFSPQTNRSKISFSLFAWESIPSLSNLSREKISPSVPNFRRNTSSMTFLTCSDSARVRHRAPSKKYPSRARCRSQSCFSDFISSFEYLYQRYQRKSLSSAPSAD